MEVEDRLTRPGPVVDNDPVSPVSQSKGLGDIPGHNKQFADQCHL